MRLLYPSAKCPASFEAQENLITLSNATTRDHVVTDVALKYFQRIQELRPGYISSYTAGVKRSVKSFCAYVLSGTAALGVVGCASWALYHIAKKLYDANQATSAIAIISSLSWASSELGFKPFGGCIMLGAAAVRDTANRTANWVETEAQAQAKAQASEIKECHKEIFKQLLDVFNDCADKLHQQYEQAERTNNYPERIQLHHTIARLVKKLPTIEKLLTQIELGSHEIENILQRLKNTIQLMQAHI